MKAIAPDDSLKWKEEGIVRGDAIEKILKKRENAAVNHGSPLFMIWMLFSLSSRLKIRFLKSLYAISCKLHTPVWLPYSFSFAQSFVSVISLHPL